ncbi:MAG: excisionase family DNA binding protein [Phenylobacterium sp.]|jgi:excisionase family DNA binding protein
MMNTIAYANEKDRIYSPTDHDVDLAKTCAPVLSQILGRHRAVPKLDERVHFLFDAVDEKDGERGDEVVLPAAALELLKNVMVQMAQGHSVTLVPIHAELTTQRAADILNVSRPHLVKLLEQGDIPFVKKGTHRRVLFSDVQAYKANIDEQRMKALDALTEQAQELDMGY